MSIEKEAITQEGRLSVILRPVLGFFMIAVFILYAINPMWMRWFAVPFPIWVQRILGKHWSTNLQLREQHTLVTSGPYHWVRHPMYTALFTFFIAGSLISANWLFILLTVVAIIGPYTRTGKEEIMMIEKFGDEYRDYLKRTGRLLPRLIRSSK
jgi:protein-S-isoprenylcysteine O-methyltransferase Ste14